MPYRETQRDASGAPSTDGNIKPNPNFDKVVSLYGPSALLRAESRSPYGDASGDTVLPTYLKASASIDKFLWLRKLLVLALVFTMSFSFVIFLFMSLPRVPESDAVQGESKEDVHRVVWGERAAVGASSWGLSLPYKLPKNIAELQTFRAALIIYKKEHQRQMQIGIICLYLFLQAFMIPGTIFLNILAGSLYGFYQALFLVLVLATVGSALCYTLSYFILKEIVYYYFPERCEWLAREVHRHRHNLFNYILFLRITPILPNWFINVSSPLVAVPFWCFSGGTFIGLIPASVVAVKAGGILSEINSLTDLYDLKTIMTISIIAVLVLVPVALKHRFDRAATTYKSVNPRHGSFALHKRRSCVSSSMGRSLSARNTGRDDPLSLNPLSKVQTKTPIFGNFMVTIYLVLMTAPTYFSPQRLEEELAELQDTALAQKLAELQRRSEATWHTYWPADAALKLKRLARDPGRFRWALGTVWSRSFTMSMTIGSKVQDAHMLIPYADMINHSFQPTCSYRWRKRDRMLEVVLNAFQTIREGDEMTFNYMEKTPNSKFMQLYGFSSATNPWDTVKFSGNSSIHLDSYLSAFNISGMSDDYYYNEVSAEEVDIFVDGAIIAGARTLPSWRDQDLPFLPSAEMRAVCDLQHECRHLLDAYPTTLEEDICILAEQSEGRSPRWNAAIKYRIDRKSLIKKIIKSLDLYMERILY